MIGHLGHRVSALLDGQLSARETEEAWSHVYSCHACRDLVEREGWIKTRLAGLCGGEGAAPAAPSALKGSLLSMPPVDHCLIDPGLIGAAHRDGHGHRRRTIGVVFLGGGAVGAAMVGVLALGFAPGSAPPADRRPPTTQIDGPVDGQVDGELAPTELERSVPVGHGGVTTPRSGDLPASTLGPTSVPVAVAKVLQHLLP